MVANFFSNIFQAVGGLFGGHSARSSYNGPSQRDILEQMATQFGYDKALANEQYNYSTKLNNQLYGLNRYLTQYNYDLQRQSRQTSFYDTRKDLESAGYNPLLALGVQSNSLNPGMTMSGNGFSMPDSGSVFSAMSSLGNIAQIKSNIDSSKYLNDLNLANTEKVRSETVGQDINNMIQNRTGLFKSLAEIENLKSQGLLSKSQARYYQKQIAVSDSQIALNNAHSAEAQSATILNRQNATLNKPSVDFARKHPVIHGTLSKIGSPTSAIGSLAGLRYLMKGGK